jgi:peptide/nickel transport system ATP-binding protein
MRGPDVLLSAEHVVVEFGHGRRRLHAVSDVSLDVAAGETLGLVGESGCGKTTLGRAIAMVHAPTSGRIRLDGTELTTLDRADLRRMRTNVQLVFQDPISSLNPRRKVRDVVAEPLNIWKVGSRSERAAKAASMLDAVGIDPDAAGNRRPVEFSGGQCQRVSIARALMLEPKLLICDEPVSALDVSVQAQILNLLEDIKRRMGLTMVFIAHDLAVVKHVSDRVAVMYLGKLCELAPPDVLYRRPAHPYTEALLESIPEPDPTKGVHKVPKRLSGELPSPLNPPSGCRFRTRCPYAQDRCAEEEPQIRELEPGQFVACHFPVSEAAGTAGTRGSESTGVSSPSGPSSPAGPPPASGPIPSAPVPTIPRAG